jgi:LmbE family N-acetylglucosaminyl deacetylase
MLMGDFCSAALIVAHPDDETLWAGGTLLGYPDKKWFIACLTRKNDKDRAPRFYKALEKYNASGAMADLDDGPLQSPLENRLVQNTILSLLPKTSYDLIITHSLNGEYSRHRRHEETGAAVSDLWREKVIYTDSLWMFAYEDGNGSYFPRSMQNAHLTLFIDKPLWNEKYKIITEIYGFKPDSFEARTTPVTESFFRFREPKEVFQTLF